MVIGALHIVNRQDGWGGFTRVLKFAISDIEAVSAVPQKVPWPQYEAEIYSYDC